jgi:hypothetical protein
VSLLAFGVRAHAQIAHVPVPRLAARGVRMRVRRRHRDGSRRRRAFDGYSIQQYRTSNQMGHNSHAARSSPTRGSAKCEQQAETHCDQASFEALSWASLLGVCRAARSGEGSYPLNASDHRKG